MSGKSNSDQRGCTVGVFINNRFISVLDDLMSLTSISGTFLGSRYICVGDFIFTMYIIST